MRSMPGPGDQETWGPYQGHPGDPRQPFEFDQCGDDIDSTNEIYIVPMSMPSALLLLKEAIMPLNNKEPAAIRINKLLAKAIKLEMAAIREAQISLNKRAFRHRDRRLL